jgi:hypothetical protein
MKFKDPAKVECPRCRRPSEYRVADLLALTAACRSCGASLAEKGRAMRRVKDEAASYFGLMMLAIYVEDQIGGEFTDEQLEPIKTLSDLVRLVEPRLAANSDAHSRAVALVGAAAGDVRRMWGVDGEPIDAQGLAREIPLLDIIDLRRWESR